jgi:2-oxoglutarate dehydrogenase E1 component
MPYPLLMAQRQRLLSSMTRRTGVAMRSFSTKPQEMESFLSGTSGVYAEQMYDNYLEDPNSVHASWKKYFDNLAKGVAFDAEDFSRPSVIPGKRAAVASGVSSSFFG